MHQGESAVHPLIRHYQAVFTRLYGVPPPIDAADAAAAKKVLAGRDYEEAARFVTCFLEQADEWQTEHGKLRLRDLPGQLVPLIVKAAGASGAGNSAAEVAERRRKIIEGERRDYHDHPLWVEYECGTAVNALRLGFLEYAEASACGAVAERLHDHRAPDGTPIGTVPPGKRARRSAALRAGLDDERRKQFADLDEQLRREGSSG